MLVELLAQTVSNRHTQRLILSSELMEALKAGSHPQWHMSVTQGSFGKLTSKKIDLFPVDRLSWACKVGYHKYSLILVLR